MAELYLTDKTRTDERVGYSFISGVSNSGSPFILTIKNDANKTQGYDIGVMEEYGIRNIQLYPVKAGLLKVEASLDNEASWDSVIPDTVISGAETEYITIPMNPGLTFRFPTKVTFTPTSGLDVTFYLFVSIANYGSNIIQ